jgi:hypothetical protein
MTFSQRAQKKVAPWIPLLQARWDLQNKGEANCSRSSIALFPAINDSNTVCTPKATYKRESDLSDCNDELVSQ